MENPSLLLYNNPMNRQILYLFGILAFFAIMVYYFSKFMEF